MSYADHVFIQMCQDILTNGTDTKEELVRPHWDDGSMAYTIKRFGICNRYDLQKEFPALTLRPTALKSATDELLWIWQKKSNSVLDLNSHIWDTWADEDATIGRAYGFQLRQRHRYQGITVEKLQHAFPEGEQITKNDQTLFAKYKENGSDIKVIYAVQLDKNLNLWEMDQINKVIYIPSFNTSLTRFKSTISSYLSPKTAISDTISFTEPSSKFLSAFRLIYLPRYCIS